MSYMADAEYYHNKGQQDAVENDYDPPHGIADSLLTWSEEGMEDHITENRAYDLGFFHTRGQLDFAEDDYSPPSGDDCKDAYDAGWESAKESSD